MDLVIARGQTFGHLSDVTKCAASLVGVITESEKNEALTGNGS